VRKFVINQVLVQLPVLDKKSLSEGCDSKKNQSNYLGDRCQFVFDPSESQRDMVGIPSRIRINTKVITRVEV